MLAEVYQKVVVLDPILFRQFSAQSDFGFLRRVGFDITPAVGNPVHMGVDADAGLVVAKVTTDSRSFARRL